MPSAESISRSCVALEAQSIGAQREGGGIVVELHPSLGAIEPVSIQPARDEPLGVRMGDAEVGERRVARIGRLADVAAAAGESADATSDRSTAFTNPAALVFLRRPRQVHRIVHDGCGRDAIEVQKLEEAEAENRRATFGSSFASGRCAKCSMR